MASRYCLKIYSELLGVLVSFCAFIWVIFHIFIMWQTSQSYNDDLRMARYLGKKSMAPINFRYYAHTYFSDICFGVLAFFSALALMYGAFVDSKTWLLVWTLGSMTGVVGKWVFYCYGKFSSSQSHPEVVKPFETAGVVLTFIYLLFFSDLFLTEKKKTKQQESSTTWWKIQRPENFPWKWTFEILFSFPLKTFLSFWFFVLKSYIVWNSPSNVSYKNRQNGQNSTLDVSWRFKHLHSQCYKNWDFFSDFSNALRAFGVSLISPFPEMVRCQWHTIYYVQSLVCTTLYYSPF